MLWTLLFRTVWTVLSCLYWSGLCRQICTLSRLCHYVLLRNMLSNCPGLYCKDIFWTARHLFTIIRTVLPRATAKDSFVLYCAALYCSGSHCHVLSAACSYSSGLNSSRAHCHELCGLHCHEFFCTIMSWIFLTVFVVDIFWCPVCLSWNLFLCRPSGLA